MISQAWMCHNPPEETRQFLGQDSPESPCHVEWLLQEELDTRPLAKTVASQA